MTQMADAKVAPILALHATLAAVTVTQSTDVGPVLSLSDGSFLRAIIAWIAMLTYAFSSIWSFREVAFVYIPTAPTRGRQRSQGNSLFYFDDIRSMDLDYFMYMSRTSNLDVLEDDVLRQVHLVSSISASKLARVQVAYVLSAVTLGAWMALLLAVRV